MFLRRRGRFTYRKLYACLEKFLCFLQLSDRANFRIFLDGQGSFSFDSSRTTGFEFKTRKSVDCVACCIYHCSAWFRQDHGFDPPYGSHQLPAYLKYSVRLKLLAQLVHSRECKRFCGLAQTARGVYPCDGSKMPGFY